MYIGGMDDKDFAGRIVFLTAHVDRWIREKNPGFNLPLMANRIARVTKVFDWDTDEGKYVLKQREISGKWKNANPQDHKFVVSVFFPELIKDGKKGLIIDEVMPRMYPGTSSTLFEALPQWMREEAAIEVSDKTFTVEPKEGGCISTDSSKRLARRSSGTRKR